MYYSQNKYWIHNNDDIETVSQPFWLTQSINMSSQVQFNKDVNYADIFFEFYTLTSITLSNEKQIDAILQCIKKEAEQEKEKDKEYYNDIEDQEKDSEDKLTLKASHF